MLSRAFSILAMACWLAASAAGQKPFSSHGMFTAQDSPIGKISLSRSTSGSLLWTPEDKLALTYYEGGLATTQDNPSRVIYREWTFADEWGVPQTIDHSLNNGNPIGGRHPALLRLADGRIFATWHDHRHSTAAGTWNDNQEIYGSTLPAGEITFPGVDQRLTLSAAGGSGDNSYTPKCALLPDGRIALVWYDYHWGTQSEIALRISGSNGVFGPPPAMNDTRLTTSGTRLTGDASASFTMPSVAADSAGNLHLLWVTGTTGVPAAMYYGRYDVTLGRLVEVTRLVQSRVAGYFDPPKLIVNPANDDVWVLATDLTISTNKELYLQRKPAGTSSFDPAIRLTDSEQDEAYPQACFDSAGRMIIVHNGDAHVLCTEFDPETQAVLSTRRVSDGVAGPWARPAVAVDDNDDIYVVYEQDSSPTMGALWFSTTRMELAACGWVGYE